MAYRKILTCFCPECMQPGLPFDEIRRVFICPRCSYHTDPQPLDWEIDRRILRLTIAPKPRLTL